MYQVGPKTGPLCFTSCNFRNVEKIFIKFGTKHLANECGCNAPRFWQRENVQFIEPNTFKIQWKISVRACKYIQIFHSNSPYLNGGYAIWCALQQMVYHRQSFVSVDELKRTIVEAYRNRSSTRASVNGIVVWSDCVLCVVPTMSRRTAGQIELMFS